MRVRLDRYRLLPDRFCFVIDLRRMRLRRMRDDSFRFPVRRRILENRLQSVCWRRIVRDSLQTSIDRLFRDHGLETRCATRIVNRFLFRIGLEAICRFDGRLSWRRRYRLRFES